MLLSIAHRVLLAVERGLSQLRRFSLFTPQQWPISGIRVVHCLPFFVKLAQQRADPSLGGARVFSTRPQFVSVWNSVVAASSY